MSCETAVIEQELRIRMQYDQHSLDWSVVINDQCYKRITSEVMEALVEYAVIVTEAS
jgi:hypothetical protein